MNPRRLALALLVALPGLTLAAAGQTHPHALTPASAHEWWTLHVWLLPMFPLLALAVLAPIWGDNRPIAWAARVAAFGFAVGYTALDAVAGIGAGLVVDASGGPQDAITGRIFEIGDRIGHAGIWSLAVCLVLVVAAAWPRCGWRTLPGAGVALAGLPWFYDHHVFAPLGVRAMVLVALGSALLAAATRPAQGGAGRPRLA